MAQEQRRIRLLIVDDDEISRELLTRRFSSDEFEVTTCASGDEALALSQRSAYDVGVLDILMPGLSGNDLLKEIKELHPTFEAIMLTGQASIDSAIESMKLGAYDYLPKPCKLFELEIIIRKAFDKSLLATQNEKLRQQLAHNSSGATLVGESRGIQTLREQVAKVAKMKEPALLVGEMGVGKEVTATEIHRASPWSSGPFLTLNCGVMTDAALEAKLFGHEAEAFVGAGPRRRGAIEFAEGGSLFLDEFDQLSPAMQVKILHFLDTGEFRRVGSFAELVADTRLIMATTDNLLTLTKRGKFREDLYYKISTFTLNVPPLRERKEDIPALADGILLKDRNGARRNKKLAKKALETLMEYNWPGNVRELENVLDRAASLAAKNTIQVRDLPISFEKRSRTAQNRHLLSLSEIEREHILFVLDAVNGNISKAAKILGVSRPKLYRKIDKYKSGAGV